MKSLPCLLAVTLATASALAAPAANETSTFNISTPSNIPGAVLQPGAYTIRVLNKLSDRVILRVDSATGDVHDTFIGITGAHGSMPSSKGAVAWSTPINGATYLKGWFFPQSSSVVEFVYPKSDALAIASANPAKVPAIDPASEGKVADNTLSQNDMQLLTLWLLSVQEVQGGGQAPAVKAERYQPTVASVAPPQRPIVTALPHTASLQPVVWIAGLFSLLLAASLRIFRIRREARSL